MFINLSFVHPHPAGWQHPLHGTMRKISWTDTCGTPRKGLAVDYYEAPDENVADALAENFIYYGNYSKTIIYRNRFSNSKSRNS